MTTTPIHLRAVDASPRTRRIADRGRPGGSRAVTGLAPGALIKAPANSAISVTPNRRAELFYCGITHRSAPLSVRERLHAPPVKQRMMLARLSDLAAGRMIVSTCERLEIYASDASADIRTWATRIAHWFHLPGEVVARHAVVIDGDATVRHLLRVAAGLDSRVLGEPHVLGQVRAAYALAMDARCLDPTLHALGRTAVHAGKRVRTETAINHARRSIASLTVEHVAHGAIPRAGLGVVVTGTGRLAADAVTEMTRSGIRRIVVAGRNGEAARGIAYPVGAASVALSDLQRAITQADALISCTGAPGYVVEPAAVGACRKRALCIVDLSVPRNVDPDVARLPNVSLTALEALLSCEAGSHTGVGEAERIVAEEGERFARWQKERRVAGDVARLTRTPRSAPPAHPGVLHQRITQLKREAVA